MTNDQIKALRLELQTKNNTDGWAEEAKHRLFTKVFYLCVYPIGKKGDVKLVPQTYAKFAEQGEKAYIRTDLVNNCFGK